MNFLSGFGQAYNAYQQMTQADLVSKNLMSQMQERDQARQIKEQQFEAGQQQQKSLQAMQARDQDLMQQRQKQEQERAQANKDLDTGWLTEEGYMPMQEFDIKEKELLDDMSYTRSQNIPEDVKKDRLISLTKEVESIRKRRADQKKEIADRFSDFRANISGTISSATEGLGKDSSPEQYINAANSIREEAKAAVERDPNPVNRAWDRAINQKVVALDGKGQPIRDEDGNIQMRDRSPEEVLKLSLSKQIEWRNRAQQEEAKNRSAERREEIKQAGQNYRTEEKDKIAGDKEAAKERAAAAKQEAEAHKQQLKADKEARDKQTKLGSEYSTEINRIRRRYENEAASIDKKFPDDKDRKEGSEWYNERKDLADRIDDMYREMERHYSDRGLSFKKEAATSDNKKEINITFKPGFNASKEQETIIENAMKAIERGAPRSEVIKRLKQAGYPVDE